MGDEQMELMLTTQDRVSFEAQEVNVEESIRGILAVFYQTKSVRRRVIKSCGAQRYAACDVQISSKEAWEKLTDIQKEFLQKRGILSSTDLEHSINELADLVTPSREEVRDSLRDVRSVLV